MTEGSIIGKEGTAVIPASGKWQVTKTKGRWWVIDPLGIVCDHIFLEQSTAFLTCREVWIKRWGWTRWPQRTPIRYQLVRLT